jgi:hypothetical protein
VKKFIALMVFAYALNLASVGSLAILSVSHAQESPDPDEPKPAPKPAPKPKPEPTPESQGE